MKSVHIDYFLDNIFEVVIIYLVFFLIAFCAYFIVGPSANIFSYGQALFIITVYFKDCIPKGIFWIRRVRFDRRLTIKQVMLKNVFLLLALVILVFLENFIFAMLHINYVGKYPPDYMFLVYVKIVLALGIVILDSALLLGIKLAGLTIVTQCDRNEQRRR